MAVHQMRLIPDEDEEFALTKDRVMAARANDAGPRTAPPEATVVRIAPDASSAAVLHLHVLGSGSKGNCTIVEGPAGAVMVDCGFPMKTAFARMEQAGVDRGTIKAIILTHEHTDHLSGVERMSRALDVPVYTAYGTADARESVSRIAGLQTVDHRAQLDICGISVQLFPTSHDAADPIGMRFECGGDAIGYATDTGILGSEGLELLSECRLLALESNHDPEMLACGPYPAYLKQRISGQEGHLSNMQSAYALRSLLCNRLQCIIGMHLSQVNNLPELASRALSDTVCHEGHPAVVAVASQAVPTSIV